MNIIHKLKVITKLGIGLTAFALLIAGCSGGGSSSGAAGGGGGTVTGVATPSKVSVVNTN